jgi:hypothetical protein
MDWAFTIIGQRGFPQSSFAPLHCKHIQAGGVSVTSMERATSSKPILSEEITFDSHVILRGSLRRAEAGTAS